MDALEIAALSMRADMDRLNVAAHNLANVSTPGFKRGLAVQANFSGAMQQAEEQQSTKSGDAAAGTARDFAAGALRATGRSLDLAVASDAFFELRTEAGLVYSRGGSFEVGADGRVQMGGAVLQLVDGDLKLNEVQQALRIDADGRVHAGEQAIGRLRLVRFDDRSALQSVGLGLYEAGAARIVDDAAAVQVRSGYVEASNVQPAQEMVKLMETTRHFEAMQKLVQGYDAVLENAIRKLGEV